MSSSKRRERGHLLWSLALGSVALLAGAILLGINVRSSAELNGRYLSTGQVVLDSGEVVDASYSILFSDGRFYAMSRQGDAIAETSGAVDYGLFGHFRLRVEDGSVTGLSKEVDPELLFNLLYSRQKGATVHLEPLKSCLYGIETRQLYCAKRSR